MFYFFFPLFRFPTFFFSSFLSSRMVSHFLLAVVVLLCASAQAHPAAVAHLHLQAQRVPSNEATTAAPAPGGTVAQESVVEDMWPSMPSSSLPMPSATAAAHTSPTAAAAASATPSARPATGDWPPAPWNTSSIAPHTTSRVASSSAHPWPTSSGAPQPTPTFPPAPKSSQVGRGDWLLGWSSCRDSAVADPADLHS